MNHSLFKSSMFVGIVSFVCALPLFGGSPVSAFKGDNPADPKYVFNIDKSASDTQYLDRDKCVSFSNGGVGVGNLTANVSATTISNRPASYMASQAFVQTPSGSVSKGNVDSTFISNQSYFSAYFNYIAPCLSIRNGYYYSFGWHKAKPMSNDPNKPSSDSVERKSDLKQWPLL
jgi:hypothetical protein